MTENQSLSSLKILFTQVQWRRQGTLQKGSRSSLPTVELRIRQLPYIISIIAEMEQGSVSVTRPSRGRYAG